MSGPGRRYELRPPAALAPDQRELYDRIVGGPRGTLGGAVPLVADDGSLLGPFGPITLAPAVGNPVQAVGAALRFESGLSPLVREAGILLVAAHHRCEFERFAHAPAAAAAGLNEAQLSALHDGLIPDGLAEPEREALAVVRSLLAAGNLTDAGYASAVTQLGERTLAELVWLVGYYSMLALALAVFDPPNPLADPRHPVP